MSRASQTKQRVEVERTVSGMRKALTREGAGNTVN